MLIHTHGPSAIRPPVKLLWAMLQHGEFLNIWRDPLLAVATASQGPPAPHSRYNLPQRSLQSCRMSSSLASDAPANNKSPSCVKELPHLLVQAPSAQAGKDALLSCLADQTWLPPPDLSTDGLAAMLAASLPPAMLVQVATATACMGSASPLSRAWLWPGLCHALLPSVPLLSRDQLLTLLAALHCAHHTSSTLLQAVSHALMQHADSLPPAAVANVLDAYSSLGVYQPALYHALYARLKAQLPYTGHWPPLLQRLLGQVQGPAVPGQARASTGQGAGPVMAPHYPLPLLARVLHALSAGCVSHDKELAAVLSPCIQWAHAQVQVLLQQLQEQQPQQQACGGQAVAVDKGPLSLHAQLVAAVSIAHSAHVLQLSTPLAALLATHLASCVLPHLKGHACIEQLVHVMAAYASKGSRPQPSTLAAAALVDGVLAAARVTSTATHVHGSVPGPAAYVRHPAALPLDDAEALQAAAAALMMMPVVLTPCDGGTEGVTSGTLSLSLPRALSLWASAACLGAGPHALQQLHAALGAVAARLHAGHGISQRTSTAGRSSSQPSWEPLCPDVLVQLLACAAATHVHSNGLHGAVVVVLHAAHAWHGGVMLHALTPAQHAVVGGGVAALGLTPQRWGPLHAAQQQQRGVQGSAGGTGSSNSSVISTEAGGLLWQAVQSGGPKAGKMSQLQCMQLLWACSIITPVPPAKYAMRASTVHAQLRHLYLCASDKQRSDVDDARWLQAVQVHALIAAGWLGPLFDGRSPARSFLDAPDAPSLPQGWLNTLQYVWGHAPRARAWCACRAMLHEEVHDALQLAAPSTRHAGMVWPMHGPPPRSSSSSSMPRQEDSPGAEEAWEEPGSSKQHTTPQPVNPATAGSRHPCTSSPIAGSSWLTQQAAGPAGAGQVLPDSGSTHAAPSAHTFAGQALGGTAAGSACWQVVGPAELRLPPEWGGFSVPLPPTATLHGRAMALMLPEQGSYAYMPPHHVQARPTATAQQPDERLAPVHAQTRASCVLPGADAHAVSGGVAVGELVLLGDALWYRRLLQTLGWVVVVVDPARWAAPYAAQKHAYSSAAGMTLTAGMAPDTQQRSGSTAAAATGSGAQGNSGSRKKAKGPKRKAAAQASAPAAASALHVPGSNVACVDAPAEHLLLAGRAVYLRDLLAQHSST